MFFYGVKSKKHACELARSVVDALGGGTLAYRMLVETSCAETKLGTYEDPTPGKLGSGICQHDEIGVLDVQKEGESRHFKIVKEVFGYDIPSVVLSDLGEDPLLSYIFCRLSYKRIPAAIPKSIEGRAAYWKKYYNTASGAGTLEHYISSVSEILSEG